MPNKTKEKKYKTNKTNKIKKCCKINKKSKTCMRKDGKLFKLPRRFSKKKCIKGPIKGFSMRSSCAPFKFCIKTKKKQKLKNTKKKQKGGNNIIKNCNNTKDPITLEEIDKNGKEIVKFFIKKDDKEEKYNCYEKENYKNWLISKFNDENTKKISDIKDPLTNIPLNIVWINENYPEIEIPQKILNNNSELQEINNIELYNYSFYLINEIENSEENEETNELIDNFAQNLNNLEIENENQIQTIFDTMEERIEELEDENKKTNLQQILNDFTQDKIIELNP